ncbi:MAG: uroporphyrinogen-III synthase [Melioribacteraceae bacterium]
MFDKTILVTKGKKEAEKHFASLLSEGVRILFFPTIKIQPVKDSPELNESLAEINKFDWLVFTSSNAVEAFHEAAKDINLDKIRVACVGTETAERCGDKNIKVDIIPNEFSAAGLIKEFSKIDLACRKVLIPGSSLSRRELNAGLTELGAEVVSVAVYDVAENDLADLKYEFEQIKTKRPDVFVFTSPSSFRNYLSLLKIDNAALYFSGAVICTIGTTTEAAIRNFGINVNIVPELFSLRGVEKAINKYFSVTKNIA